MTLTAGARLGTYEILAPLGGPTSARVKEQRELRRARRAPFFVGTLGWALAAAGRDGEARAVLEELRARPAASPTVVSEAWLLGALGEIDDAFDVLARAEEEHQGLLSYTGLPGFDPLRSDPRFAALMKRLGLSPG